MSVLRVFLMAVAGAFASVSLFGLWLMTRGHSGIPTGGVLLLGGGALAWAVFRQARVYTIKSTEGQQAQFESTVRQLAQKNGGVAPIGTIVNATGFSRDRAEQKMRELVGRGVFDLDFAENGELQFKLTPLDEARAQLAAMQDKRLPPASP